LFFFFFSFYPVGGLGTFFLGKGYTTSSSGTVLG